MARSAPREGNGDGTRFGEPATENAAPPGELNVGSVIAGKYRLERLLGEGGMGAVWRAQHLQLELPVALKLLLADGDQANLSARLKIEARAVARLTHPAIVRVFDIDATESGEPFIVMELLEGESLADLLERGRLSGPVAVQTLLPIAEGLALAHAKGIIHRDLKPHNVFITQGEERVQPKLLDFGIAKLTSSPLPTGSLTDTGVLLGSPDYMSPEQARGKSDVDSRADIWQFCVVLYESITGMTPFDGENYNALMRAIVEDEPTPLPLENGVDQRLRELVNWGLAKDREQRPASIQELARALAEWLIEQGINEDITFAPLGQKWLMRVAAKSVPLVPTDEAAAEPPLVPHNDTLLSPGLPARVVERSSSRLKPKAARPKPAVRPVSVHARPRVRPAVALVLAVLGVGLTWAFWRSPARPVAAVVAPPRSVAVAAIAPAPPVRVDLAPTPPQPSVAEPVSSARSVTSASPAASAVRGSSAGVPKPAHSVVGPSTATKPTPDGHDETRELLQAY